MTDSPLEAPSALERERETLLDNVHAMLDSVMVILSAVWIALLIAELVTGDLPASLMIAVWVIWGLFVLDIAVEFAIAPAKLRYVRTHWLGRSVREEESEFVVTERSRAATTLHRRRQR